MPAKEFCKVMGGINFCLGLSRENDVFVPSSALLEDIKKLTASPSQVLAIFEKDIDSELYSTVKHVAKTKLPPQRNLLRGSFFIVFCFYRLFRYNLHAHPAAKLQSI